MQEAINKKYTQVKNKLDGMGYTGTLHPDSVPLVQKLTKDLQRISTQYQNLKTRFNSRVASEASNNTSYSSKAQQQLSVDYKFDLLNKQYCELKQKYRTTQEQNDELKNGIDSNTRIQQIRQKYDNKMTEYLNKLQLYQKKQHRILGQKRRLEDSVDQLNRQLQNIKDQLQSKQRTLLNQTKQRIHIRKQYDDVLNTTGSLDNRRIQQLNSILQRKNNRIQQLQQQLAINKSKLTSYMSSHQQSQIEKKHLTLSTTNLNCLVESLKSQIKEMHKNSNEMKYRIDQLLKQQESNRKYRISLERQLQDLQKLQIEKNYSNQAKQSAKQKLSILYKQSNKELEHKRLEYQTLQAQKNGLQRIIKQLENKVNEMSSKNLILNKNITSLQQQYDLINTKYSQKLKEFHELNVQKQQLQRASKQVQPMKLKYLQLQAKYNQLLISGDISSGMESKTKVQYEHQIRILQQQISILKQRDSQLEIRNQKLSNQIQRVKVYMDNGNKQMQIVNSQKQSLLKDNKDMKQQLDALSLRIHNSKTDDIRKVQRMNSDQILIHDLKSKLEDESQKVRTLLNQNKLLETDIRKNEQKNRQLYEDNVQLKSMCQSLQHNKNQLLGKLKRSTSQREFNQTEKIKESSEINILKQKIQQYQKKIRQNQQALLNINDLRDEQEVELNKKILQNSELVERVRKLQHDIRNYDQSLGQNQYSLLGFQAQLKNMQNQNNTLIKRNQKLEQELRNIQNHASRFEKDIKRRTNQQSLLIASNNDLSKQIRVFQNTLNSLKQTLEQRTNQLDQTKTNYQMKKLEYQEMNQQYLDLVNQIKRLQAIVNELEHANNHMYDVLKVRDQEIQELRQVVEANQYKQAQYMAEINNFQKNLTLLSNQVNWKDQDLRNIVNERDFLKSQVSVSKPTIDLKSLVQQRLEQTQCQLNLKKREVQNHQMENRKLVSALQQERMLNYKLSKQLQEGRYGSHIGTPIRNLMSESMEQSQMQNCSLHSNRIQTDRIMRSFQSDANSISSKELKNNHQKIVEKFQNRTKFT